MDCEPPEDAVRYLACICIGQSISFLNIFFSVFDHNMIQINILLHQILYSVYIAVHFAIGIDKINIAKWHQVALKMKYSINFN